jgi:hypothetical protein
VLLKRKFLPRRVSTVKTNCRSSVREGGDVVAEIEGKTPCQIEVHTGFFFDFPITLLYVNPTF